MNRINKIAYYISLFCNPLFLAPVVFTFILFTDKSLSLYQQRMFTFITILFSSAIPLGFLLILWLRGDIKSIEINTREKRVIPLLLGVLHFFIGFVILWILKAPSLITGLMFCYATNTLVIVIITLYWKISLNTTGIAGPMAALFSHFGWQVMPFWIVIILVGISRIVLKKHTAKQVIAGMVVGWGLTVIQLHFLFLK